MPARKRRQQGFSLVEIIVIIVVGAFLGIVVVNLMGTQLTKSGIPLMSTKEAAGAEAALENIVANYTAKVNADISTALNDVSDDYPGNSTVSFTRSTFNSVDTLSVTVTVGSSSYTTLLTQERQNAADNAATF